MTVANVLSLDFEAGTLNDTLTPANSGAALVTGSPTFADGAIEGDLCVRANATSAQHSPFFDHAPISGTGWASFYFTVAALPAANAYIALWNGGTTNKVCDVRLQPDGAVVMRDNNVAVITSPTGLITANSYHRLAMRATPNSQLELRLYVGANRHGTTPDWSGTGNSTRNFALDRFAFGTTAAATIDIRVDRVRIDDAVEPAPMDAGPGASLWHLVTGPGTNIPLGNPVIVT